MNNFHEVSQIRKEEQKDIFDEPEKQVDSEVISKQQLDNLDDYVDQLAETDFEHEFEDEISEETARLNEYELREDEPYAVIVNKTEKRGKKEKSGKEKYELYNKAHGSSEDEYLGHVWASSPAQALLLGHKKNFNMTERTISRATGIFYKPEKKQV